MGADRSDDAIPLPRFSFSSSLYSSLVIFPFPLLFFFLFLFFFSCFSLLLFQSSFFPCCYFLTSYFTSYSVSLYCFLLFLSFASYPSHFLHHFLPLPLSSSSLFTFLSIPIFGFIFFFYCSSHFPSSISIPILYFFSLCLVSFYLCVNSAPSRKLD